MTDLVIRKIPFVFDGDVPFQWQPNHPTFSVFSNAFTFMAVPFEKYIVGAVRMAQDHLDDPAIADEAEAFLRQEAQHASAHRKHMKALIANYPDLDYVYKHTLDSYDRLLASQSLEFHVCYIANLEATFTPFFKVILDHRDSLLNGGDRRVASLMMWHFVEEIEHRSSGLALCHYLTPSRWTRLKYVRQTFNHTLGLFSNIAAGFDRVVPESERVISARAAMGMDILSGELLRRAPFRRNPKASAPSLLNEVPNREIASMLWRLLLSQMPNHNPTDQPLPEYAGVWMSEYARGTDMTAFCGTPASTD